MNTPKRLTCLTSNVDAEMYDLHSIFAGLAGDALQRSPKSVSLQAETTILTQEHRWMALVSWSQSNGTFAVECASGKTPDQAINACLDKLAPEPNLEAILGYAEVRS